MENTQQKGCLTEQKCFLKCLEAGFMVSKPLFDNATIKRNKIRFER